MNKKTRNYKNVVKCALTKKNMYKKFIDILCYNNFNLLLKN